MYTLKDLAKMTQMTPRTIQNYLAKGILTGLKVGGQWRFTEDQVKTFFENGSVAGQLAQQGLEAIHHYLEQPNQYSMTRASMCSTWHLFAPEAEVQRIVGLITDHIKANIKGDLSHFSYTYQAQIKAGRFVVIGSFEVVKSIVELCPC